MMSQKYNKGFICFGRKDIVVMGFLISKYEIGLLTVFQKVLFLKIMLLAPRFMPDTILA